MLLFIGIEWLMGTRLFNFNTSHVTVYLDETGENKTLELFQYISCYCLSRSRRLRPALKSISIHLMLLFINSGYIRSERLLCISIHLMLLFIGGGDSWYGYLKKISIHLMLLFIRSRSPVKNIPGLISIHLMLLFIRVSVLLWSG